MYMHRFVQLTAAIVAAPVLLAPPSAASAAERYPSRAVTFVVPYSAGSQTDSVARLIGQYLQEALGQPFVIENKTGGGGVVAALAVARAPPDGYTLMVTTNTQIMFESMKNRLGIDIVRIAYRSVPAATTDLVAGHIAIAAPDFINGMPFIRAGKIRPLAVMTKERGRVLPDVPTLDETVMPGFDIHAWAGMFGPAGLSAETIETLDRELAKILARPDVKTRFLDAGSEVLWKGPAEFSDFVKAELVKWTALIREAGIQPE
jgi:tripartite-type tricarboxylate transporter receptor subunit TctC